MEELTSLKRVLRCFQLVSGLELNLLKSSLVGVGCPKELVRSLASIINFKVGKLSTMYLGLPIGARVGSAALWNSVI